MPGFTDPLEVDILKAVTAQATTILPTAALTAVWVGLSTTTPSDSVAGTPPSGGAYARSDATGDWGTPAAGSVTNSNAIAFPTATGDWGTQTHFELFDASTGGNRFAWGDTPSFAPGTLTLTLD